MIERSPERLRTLEGIGAKRQARVTEAWREQKAIREIMVFLHSHGIGSARAARIYRVYGTEAIDRIRENPYRLALDITGIGFMTADVIARKLGIPSDSLIRIRAALHHVLWECSSEGHCATERSDLVERTVELLEVSPPVVEQAIGLEVASENLMTETLRGEPALFLAPLYRAEVGVAGHLRRLLKGSPPWGVIDGDRALPWVEALTGLSLSPSQREAVDTVLKGKVTVLTGGPGSERPPSSRVFSSSWSAAAPRCCYAHPPGAPPSALGVRPRRGQDHPSPAGVRSQTRRFSQGRSRSLGRGSVDRR